MDAIERRREKQRHTQRSFQCKIEMEMNNSRKLLLGLTEVKINKSDNRERESESGLRWRNSLHAEATPASIILQGFFWRATLLLPPTYCTHPYRKRGRAVVIE